MTTEHYASWAVEQVWGSDRFYSEGDVAEDQVAFVIDSGVALLDDLNVNKEWSRSFIPTEPNPHSLGAEHGTAVASLIGAKADGKGLTGVAPGAEIVALKALRDSGWGAGNSVNNALAYARDVIIENDLFDRAVVNLSLGARQPDIHPLVREMADMGITVVVSAGNASMDVDGYSPASYGDHENVYTISATTQEGYYSGFTNYDNADSDGVDDVDFAAPGSAVPTYNTDGTIGFRNGTSFSAPLVSGILLMSEEVKAGQTFTLRNSQRQKGMVPDPLAMFDPDTYKHEEIVCPEPEPIYIEVPVPGPVVEVPVDPITGDWGRANVLRGTIGDDLIYGGNLGDNIKAGSGNDTIIGFEGNDRLRGGHGDDEIFVGGSGVSKVWGGSGADRFYLSEGPGRTTILDYVPGEDTLVASFDYQAETGNKWTKIWSGNDLVARIAV